MLAAFSAVTLRVRFIGTIEFEVVAVAEAAYESFRGRPGPRLIFPSLGCRSKA